MPHKSKVGNEEKKIYSPASILFMLDVLEKPGSLLIHPRLFAFCQKDRILSLLSADAGVRWLLLLLFDFFDDDDDFFAPLSYREKDEDERHRETIPISSEPEEPP